MERLLEHKSSIDKVTRLRQRPDIFHSALAQHLYDSPHHFILFDSISSLVSKLGMQPNKIAFPPMVLWYDRRVGVWAWRRRQVQTSVPKDSPGQHRSFHNCILVSGETRDNFSKEKHGGGEVPYMTKLFILIVFA